MSDAEETMAFHLRAAGIAFDREVRIIPERRWRADFGFPGTRILLEIEGGVWTGGRHTTGAGFIRDAEKYNAAAMAGYTVLRVTTAQVESGEALTLVEKALGRVPA